MIEPELILRLLVDLNAELGSREHRLHRNNPYNAGACMAYRDAIERLQSILDQSGDDHK